MIRIPAVAFVAALVLAPTVAAAPTPDDPSQWPVVDNGAYTSPGDPGWVFFLTSSDGRGCGISPSGTVGCDIVVSRSADGTVVQAGVPGPPGFYSCSVPGEKQLRCPLPPPGANQIVADAQNPARYNQSAIPTFTRKLAVLPLGHRIVNGGAWCSLSEQGVIDCATGSNGFIWNWSGGILEYPSG